MEKNIVSPEKGIKIIKKAYDNRLGCELTEENGFISIRIRRRLLMGDKANAEWFRKTNFFLKNALKKWDIPFNTVEFDDCIVYNLEAKEVI